MHPSPDLDPMNKPIHGSMDVILSFADSTQEHAHPHVASRVAAVLPKKWSSLLTRRCHVSSNVFSATIHRRSSARSSRKASSRRRSDNAALTFSYGMQRAPVMSRFTHRPLYRCRCTNAFRKHHLTREYLITGRWPSFSGNFSPAAGSPCTSSKVVCVATAAMYAQAHNSPNTTTTSSTMTPNQQSIRASRCILPLQEHLIPLCRARQHQNHHGADTAAMHKRLKHQAASYS